MSELSQEETPIETNLDDVDLADLDLEGSDTEALTPAQVIDLLKNAWLNEKFAPEILPHKSEVVECIMGQLTYMEENLENLESGNFTKSLHQIEVDRLRYMVTSYMRSRLEKIELYPLAILKDEEARAERNEEGYLTEGELQFAKNYKEAMEEHFDNALSFWDGLRPDDWKKEPVLPNMYSFVFLKSNAEIEGVMLDEGNDDESDLIDFKKGSQMILSYSSVANLVKKGDVQLI